MSSPLCGKQIWRLGFVAFERWCVRDGLGMLGTKKQEGLPRGSNCRREWLVSRVSPSTHNGLSIGGCWTLCRDTVCQLWLTHTIQRIVPRHGIVVERGLVGVWLGSKYSTYLFPWHTVKPGGNAQGPLSVCWKGGWVARHFPGSSSLGMRLAVTPQSNRCGCSGLVRVRRLIRQKEALQSVLCKMTRKIPFKENQGVRRGLAHRTRWRRRRGR